MHVSLMFVTLILNESKLTLYVQPTELDNSNILYFINRDQFVSQILISSVMNSPPGRWWQKTVVSV